VVAGAPRAVPGGLVLHRGRARACRLPPEPAWRAVRARRGRGRGRGDRTGV